MCNFCRVPRDKATSKPLDEWKNSIAPHVDEKNVDLNGMVCIKHFLKSDITKSDSLKRYAFPTVFDTITPIAADGVQDTESSNIPSEIIDSTDSISSIPCTASDEGREDQIESNPSSNESCASCQNYRTELEKLRKDSLIEKNNNSVQLCKLENKIKMLQTTISNQTKNIRNLNKRINEKVEGSEKLQSLVNDLKQQNDLNGVAVETLQVHILLCPFVLKATICY